LKVCIIALNGLDYDLALKFKSLSQEEIGHVIVDINPLISCVIWGSFITGVKLEWKGGSQRDYRIPSNLKTIFDYAEKPIALWVPAYNPHPSYWHPNFRNLAAKAKSSHNDFLVFEKEMLNLFYEQRNKLLNKLDGNWDLLMAHFNLIDSLGHILPKGRMIKYVVLVAKMVSEIKKRLKNTVILLVSDHGVNHTPNAFYSSNIKLGLNNPKITEFFNVIVSLLQK